jgi:hypothetical protein
LGFVLLELHFFCDSTSSAIDSAILETICVSSEKVRISLPSRDISSGPSGPQPAQESGNEVYSSVGGSSQPSGMGLPSSCTKGSSQNPADLLPKDNNSQWAQLNPAGKGDLANINLLKAGYHIGIDTVGQTLRNANLQIRSEPPNPQVNVGPWNLSTIEPDFMRPPLQLGQGGQ